MYISSSNLLILDGVDGDNRMHRELLLSLFMTTSDLSDQTKPWESAIKVSDLLYAEFFSQGDQVSSQDINPCDERLLNTQGRKSSTLLDFC